MGLILRLLDNDELSPEQVNDVKDFLEDYVERNQDDFEEFSDVDELYSSLPLDKVEALEDLVVIGQPGHVKGSKSQVAAAISPAVTSKTTLASSTSQSTVFETYQCCLLFESQMCNSTWNEFVKLQFEVVNKVFLLVIA